MTWARLDDQFFRHPKARAAGKDGRALFLASLCFAAGNLTDGVIRSSDLALVAAEAEVRQGVAKRLVAAGLWDEVEGIDGWIIHDWDHLNPSADDIKERREKEREKKRRYRRDQEGRYVSPRLSPGDTPRESRRDTPRESPGESTGDSFQPVPVPITTSPSSSNGRVANGCDDDRIRMAVRLIADQRIARLAQPPSNPDGYRQTVAGDVHRAHRTSLATALRDHPDWTPTQLAHHVEPPTPPPAPRPTDPLEQSATAQRQRDQRLAAAARGEACATCDHLGVVDNGDGTWRRCTDCQT